MSDIGAVVAVSKVARLEDIPCTCPGEPLFEIIFVDDLGIVLLSRCPVKLINLTSEVLGIIQSIFDSFGLIVNWAI